MRVVDLTPDDIANIAAVYALIYRGVPLGDDLREKFFRQRPVRKFTFDTFDRDGEILRISVQVEENPNLSKGLQPEPPPMGPKVA